MGILNVTPDSFSDGGKYAMRGDALRQAERMLLDGADIIDIGGESTRPGAPPVPLDEELERVIPLIEQLRSANVPLSVDTYKPEVMRHALSAGADLINDIWGFRMPGAVDAVRDSECGLCVMHMLGEPQTMQLGEPAYDDVVREVRQFLEERVATLKQAGIAMRASAWIQVLASARPWSNTITRCSRICRTRRRRPSRRTLFSPACRASRWSARSSDARRRSASRAASQQRCVQPSGALQFCACTTSRKQWMH